MTQLFTIYSQRLAGYLMLNGFSLIRMVRDSKTGKNDFLFANTELLHDYIDRWQIERIKQ